jgi:hypothetical protein
MRYVRVRVTRDTNTVHNSLVAPWEVPVLEYIFEDGNVNTLDEHESNEREYPDAGSEFGRLIKAYGSDPKSGIPYAVSTYGEGRNGMKALRDAIAEAKSADVDAGAPKPAKTRRSAPKAHEADPLMV